MGIPVKVKVCGITSVDAVVKAVEAGADAIGIVFYHKSPRNVSDLALARQIALAVGPFVSVVGLFVNPGREHLERVLAEVPLGLLQFHGDETDIFCKSFQRPFLKALRMEPSMDVDAEISRFPSAQGFLLDAYKPGVPGGTGETFDWGRVPKQSQAPIVLAGGLTPANVVEAVVRVQPWAVDVSGGVESSPGVKDPQKINQFIFNAKSAFATK